MAYPPPPGYGSYGPAGYPAAHDAHSAAYAPPPGGHPPPNYPPPSGSGHAAYGGHPGHDAAAYEAYYRQSGYPPPPGGGYGHPPPGGSYPPAGAGGYPPPGGEYPPPPHGGSYPPPPGGVPPPGFPGAAPYGPYGAPPPGYPPYGYGPQPGYGAPPPPGYGPQPGGRGGSPRRDSRRSGGGTARSRSRDRKGRGKGRDRKDDRDRGGRTPIEDKGNPAEPRTRVQQWLQIHSTWSAVWLEGIDPPYKPHTAPNITMLILANAKKKDKGGSEDFGFVLAHAPPSNNKKKDRERECAKDLVSVMDQLPFEDMKAWCQLPDASAAKQVQPSDLERVSASVQKRMPKVAVEMPEPISCVLTAVMPWGPAEGRQCYSDPELDLLDRFDVGFGELFREARRVSGIVRKQWFLSIIWAKQEASSRTRPFCLGCGFATDRHVAKVRAVHSAEARAQILSEAMFVKEEKEN